ncbi:MAG: amino acid/amide transporter substrate-binding protein family [Mycobacterium sp.]|jgi:branched-chain amino acid transport system substrate-binding protein|nr:amino acid/amide transporter substrate-binding protein family [Mycobacterium sp.]
MSRSPALALTACAASAVLMVSACGSSSSSATKPAAKGSAAPASLSPAGSFTLDTPVKIVSIISSKGQDSFAVSDFNDGIQLAISEINAAGGIGGHPVEFQAIATPPYGDITNAFNQAVAAKPSLIIGPVSSTTLLTIAKQVDKVSIPVISDATDPNAALDGSAGSKWLFGIRPFNSVQAADAIDYLTNELNAKKVGLMYFNAAFGLEGAKAAKSELAKNGATVSKEVPFDVNAKDLTSQVQSMKGSDAVFDWGTPDSLTTAVLDFAQQGLADVPHIGPGSVGYDSFVKAGDPSTLDNAYGVLDCNPNDDPRPATKAWTQRFVNKYGYRPAYSAAELYDAVMITRSIIEKTQKADPETIRAGLSSLDYKDGVCATEYKNNDNVLSDQDVVVSLKGANWTTKKTYNRS